MTISDIISKWTEITSDDYSNYVCSKLVKQLLSSYDTEGRISLLVLREDAEERLKNLSIDLWSLFNGSDDSIKKYKELYDIFNNNEVQVLEKSLVDSLHKMFSSVVGVELLEDSLGDASKLHINLRDVIVDIEKLKLDIYRKSDAPLRVSRFNRNLYTFNSLGEAILAIDSLGDGCYITFINVNYTSDSYFAIFIKDGANLVSLNDRIDEEYPGQHRILNQRNGRWASDKRCNLFPYDSLLDYSDYCSKGCAMTFRVKEGFNENEGDGAVIPLSKLHAGNGYESLMLGLVLIKQKFNDLVLQGEVKVPDSLIPSVVGLEKYELALKNEGVKNLPAVQNFECSIAEIFDEAYVEKICEKSEIASFYKSELQVNIEELKLCGLDGIQARPEYVGSLDRLQKGYEYLIKDQMASEIEESLKDWYRSFDMTKWLTDSMKEHAELLLRNCLKVYSKESLSGVHAKIVGGRGKPDDYIRWSRVVNKKTDDNMCICPLSGGTATMFFIFSIESADGLHTMFGPERFIRELETWGKRSNENPLLNMVDPFKTLRHPLNGESVKIGIGFSKRAFKKFAKEAGIEEKA